MPIDVAIRGRTGEILQLPEKWATLLAENLRAYAYASVHGDEVARSAADKIESRLVGADDTPVEFDDDESIEVLEGLTAVAIGWHKTEECAWEESEAHAFYRGFAGPD